MVDGAAPQDALTWAEKYPEIGIGPVPIEPCISEDYFEKEREAVFGRAWLNIGHESSLPEPGDFFVKPLGVLRTSVLVIRGNDGKIRAFHNICPHRSNKLVWDACGKRKMFACSFHGWTFDSAGKLISVPDEDQFASFNTENYSLAPIHLDIWNGFLFINMEKTPRQSLRDFLGPWGAGIDGYCFDQLSFKFGWMAEFQCNWKVAMDAFQEGYHAPFVHRNTVASHVANASNALVHPLSIELFDKHRILSIPSNVGRNFTPTESLAQKHGAASNRYRDMPNVEQPKGVNPTKARNWAFDSSMVYPNFTVILFPMACTTYNFWPVAVDRTIFELRTYLPKEAGKKAGDCFALEYSKIMNREVILEDLSTLEHTQSSLRAGVYDHFLTQNNEICIRHSHKVIGDAVAAADVETKTRAVAE